MRMNLKNKKFKNFNFGHIKFTSKNLFIFLTSFSIIAIVIGVIFYFLLSSSDKSVVDSSVSKYFVFNENINYVNSFKESILSNTYNIFLIWVLGISVIGILASIFIYFCEFFSVGFSLASLFNIYGVKGILASICYLLTSKVCFMIVLFILTFFSIKISYKLIKLCFTKEDINIKKEISKYFKVLLFSFIMVIVISMLKVFVDPFLIKFFTRI